MVCNATSTGSLPKRHPIDRDRGTAHRLLARAAGWMLLAVAMGAGIAEAQGDLLPNERAFAFSARGLDERTIEARFVIADGYYLYREKLKFDVAPEQVAGALPLPPGKVKTDKFFGTVEIYRGQLVVRLPLQRAAPGQRVTVTAESQGCADVEVCYPPQRQSVSLPVPLAGARPGGLVYAVPPKKSWLD
jgi:thioredoxin:protein disulfide reductase